MGFWIYLVQRGAADSPGPAWISWSRSCSVTVSELDNEVSELQVEDKGVAIGRDGPVEGLPPQVMLETEVSCQ